MNKRAPREWKKCDVNSDPWSEDTWSRMPCFAETWVAKASATSTAVAASAVGMKIIPWVTMSDVTSCKRVERSDVVNCSCENTGQRFCGFARVEFLSSPLR